MTLSTRVERLIDSFKPLFHIYHLPLGQKYSDPQYVNPREAEVEVRMLRSLVRIYLDGRSFESSDPDEETVIQAFRTVLCGEGRDYFEHYDHLISAWALWDAERKALSPSSLAFVPW